MQFKEFNNQIRRKLKNIRQQQGITQGELSNRIGKPQSTISRFENATEETINQIDLVFDICRCLGVPFHAVCRDAMEGENINRLPAFNKVMRCISCDKALGFSRYTVEELNCNLCNGQNRKTNNKNGYY